MPQFDEDVDVLDNQNRVTVKVQAEHGNIELGTARAGGDDGVDGDLLINSRSGNRTIHMSGDGGNARFGGLGAHGRLTLFRSGETDPDHDTKATIYVNGHRANIRLGGNGAGGDIAMFRSGKSGDELYDYAGTATVRLDGENGNLWLGNDGVDGDLVIRDSSGAQTIGMNGDSGDIVLSNADCAEEFDISEPLAPEAGTVMVLGERGELEESRSAYDKRVVGVISGAGNFKPGLVLDRRKTSSVRVPIALVGKAFCKVDAQYGAIQIGDLLTTSPTAGHAMAPDDPQRAFGCVIGKALQPLHESTGLIPILIALQ